MEIFDVVDENGNPTGETVERSVAHVNGIRHRTVHIWIARECMGKWQVLLQKRAMTKDSFPGRYDTSSSGHIQAGDKPLESAIRELEEELGVVAAPEQLEFAGTFRIQYEKEFHNKLFKDNEVTFVYVYLGKVDIEDIVVQEEELECVEWFDLDEIYNECLKHNQKFCVPVKGLEIARDYLNRHYSIKRMDISTLCNKIELQPNITKQVLLFIENFDFQAVDELQKGYFNYNNMQETLTQTQALLGKDTEGIKILACMLKTALHTYEIYMEKGISEDIYFDTMKCFTRFINETQKMTGRLCFDRYWWTTRQVGCHLFRIGELEYEIKHINDDIVISMHIPSDADFSPIAVEKSLKEAYKFFKKYYPSLCNAEYRCHSWLLDSQLKSMLGKDSNIINFQNRFEIFDEGEAETEFIEWLYNTKSTDYNTLPENTSLQINVKKHLLAGGLIRNAYGKMKMK